MARKATSLGPKPSLSVFCFYFVFFFVGGGAGFRGQVRWPKGPHLALNPPHFVLVFIFAFFCVSFLFLVVNKKCFAPILECLPLFFFVFFWPPLFQCFFSVFF